METVWNDRALPGFPALEGDIKTDVLIIGGGMTGVLCALLLKQAGVDCILIEGDRIAAGTTGRTTAKITVQHGLFCRKLLRRYGEEKARAYLDANCAALEKWQQLCAAIPCDLETKDSYVYSLRGKEPLEQELCAMEKLGFPGEYAAKLSLPFVTDGAVRVRGQGQFHPLQFLAGVLPGLRIYEHTAARAFHGKKVFTGRGSIQAENIIVATHFPILNKHGAYFLKLFQSRSYVLAVGGAEKVDGMYVDEAEKGLSFRDSGGRLLIGGGDHRTGKQGGGWPELKAFVRVHYPEAEVTAQWAAQDCMSLDGIPYIGAYSPRTPGLYVATGFNKWGMTSSMAAAMILSDQIQGRENPWAEVFAPNRTMLHRQLGVNAWESAVNLLTPTAPRCPHMGCALKWNPREHSWDCPCHGSRFTEKGKLLENPATGDMKRDLPK